MSTNIIPFDSYKPTAVAVKAAVDRNADLLAGVSGGFPVLSIKGKVFTLVKDKERKVLMRPDDEDTPAAAIEVVIVSANQRLSKVFYKEGYEDGSAAKPDCFSNDGITPDSSLAEKQAKTCAVCDHNVWGSGKGGKGKACQDSRRLAISSPAQINEPMLLRVPPASLKPLAEFARTLSNRGLAFDQVLTKLKFDKDEATPKLVFTPIGVLPQGMQDEIHDVAASDEVGQIIGTVALPQLDDDFTSKPEKKAAKPAPDDDDAPAAKSAKKAAKPAPDDDDDAPAAKPAKKAAKPAADDDLDAALDGLFDDE